MAAPPAEAVAGTVRAQLETGRSSRGLEVGFKALLIACLGICLAVLVVLLIDILVDGVGGLSLSFLTDAPRGSFPIARGSVRRSRGRCG